MYNFGCSKFHVFGGVTNLCNSSAYPGSTGRQKTSIQCIRNCFPCAEAVVTFRMSSLPESIIKLTERKARDRTATIPCGRKFCNKSRNVVHFMPQLFAWMSLTNLLALNRLFYKLSQQSVQCFLAHLCRSSNLRHSIQVERKFRKAERRYTAPKQGRI